MRPKTGWDKIPPPGNSQIPNHLIIEGDNLVSLSALAYTHAGKIDVIYIDPPYNTGNKDFVYNDSFVDKEDAYRHSKWLSFMERRLRIAKKLLSDRGVIFISIDDNEQANLKLLCDSIFGDAYFISSMPRLTKKAGKTTTAVAVNHDYVLIYSKLKNFNLLEHKDPAFKHKDEYFNIRGPFKLSQTLDYDTLGYVNSLDYPIEINGEVFYAGNVSEREYKERKQENPKNGYRWRWSEELFQFGLANGFVVVRRTKKASRVYTKTYKNAIIKKENGLYAVKTQERGVVFSSIDLIDNIYSNDNARKELDELFDDKTFDYPKPIALPRVLSRLSTTKDSIILDFFAGSGTTLHAVMQLNAEDGGHRQCILCTNNENGICENVTYERNKRVIQGYTKPNGEKVEGLHDNNLRYYRTEFIGRSRTPRNMQRLVELSTDMLCIKEDLYAEQTEFGGMRVVPRVFRYFAEGERKMLIIYREEYIEEIVGLIAKEETTAPIRVYVFSPCEDPASELFEPVAEKVEPVALPAAIYNTYKRILPKRRDRRVDTEGGTYTETDNELGGLFETQDEA